MNFVFYYLVVVFVVVGLIYWLHRIFVWLVVLRVVVWLVPAISGFWCFVLGVCGLVFCCFLILVGFDDLAVAPVLWVLFVFCGFVVLICVV